MYKIWIIKPAQKQIKSLPKSEISEIIGRIKNLAINPHPAQSKKLKGATNCYRLRKGKYRILYTLDRKAKEITIYKVTHRKEAYC